MESVFLLLGSNLGNKNDILQEALHHISLECGSIVSYSKIYSSEPWGFESCNSFLNMAVKLETELSPSILLESILKIETELGRTRVNDKKYHSRTIDIDIIFYGNLIIETDTLVVPHPKMHLRRFVLTPLNDIAPKYIHPVLNRSVKDLLKQCLDKSIVVSILLNNY